MANSKEGFLRINTILLIRAIQCILKTLFLWDMNFVIYDKGLCSHYRNMSDGPEKCASIFAPNLSLQVIPNFNI